MILSKKFVIVEPEIKKMLE
ncbi:hypothetical protein CAT7_11815 [Carnobacterium sp. AT7]|nr:hypothetical protein CAT7_11815 [Carnobacterium sp. AT7]